MVPVGPAKSAQLRLASLLTGAAALLGGGPLLYLVPPLPGGIYPPCLFHALTGLHCPGCGSTRCLHALLHGELRQAAAFNVLLLLAVPFLAYSGARFLWSGPESRHLPAWILRVILVVVIAFWILRNIPCAPFNLLAPHILQ